MAGHWSEQEKYHVETMLGELIVGSPLNLERQLTAFIASTPVDELMISSTIYDAAEQLRSYKLVPRRWARVTRSDEIPRS